MVMSVRAVALRLFSVICFMIACIVIFASRERFETYSDEYVDKAADWNSLMFCAILFVVVGFYNFVTTFLSERSPLWNTVVFLDSIICMFISSSLAVGWLSYAMLLQGKLYSVGKWSPVNDVYSVLCRRILVSMIFSTLGFLANFIIFAVAMDIGFDPCLKNDIPI